MSTHELGIVKSTEYSPVSWKPTRPKQSWKPFGGDNGAKGKEPTYWAKSRDGSTHQIYNDMSSSDITDSNPNGIWTSDNSDGAWTHLVLHKKDHSTFMQLGWDSNSSVSAIKNAANIAPITNFSGMAFKWNRRGSYWDDSSINIDSVYFTIYDGEADKVWEQKADLWDYKGLNPMQNGDPNTTDNNCYFKTSNADWNWCNGQKRYLIGLTVQFFQKSRGSASHSRVFRIYDLQPIYGASAIVGNAHQVIMNSSNYSAIDKAVNGGANRVYLI